MENKRFISPPMVGISSLLVIFAVLCLTVFSLLSISTVQADRRLGDRNQAAVEAYYQADCCAQRLLARLRAGAVPRGVEKEGNMYSYYCAISHSQALAVEVEADSYRILRYQTVSTLDWQADDKILVWDGQEQ